MTGGPRNGGSGRMLYYMNSFDSFTGEILHQPLELPCPEEYVGCEVRLANFDIQTEQEWVFFLQIWPNEGLEEPIAYLVYPGVLEGGMIQGCRIGLAPEARPHTMMISGQYGEQENWTLEELLNLADGNIDAVRTIIFEEVKGYFSHVREADAVAALIQNRVQLYLDEQWSISQESRRKKGGGRIGGRHSP